MFLMCVLLFVVLTVCHVNVSFDQSKLNSSSPLVLKILTYHGADQVLNLVFKRREEKRFVDPIA